MDRITRVRIKNVRSIGYMDLEISRPLTVLIGENGSGKSSLIECLELLRKAADSTFMSQLYAQHRGMPGLLRKGAPALELGVVIEDDADALPRIEYTFVLAPKVAGAQIVHEHLQVGLSNRAQRPLVALLRGADRGEIFDEKEGKLVPLPPEILAPDQLLVASFGRFPPQKAIERLLTALRGIEVHLPFDTLAAWGAQAVERQPTLRGAGMLTPADRLTLLGRNLASAWSALKNIDEAHWQETMAMVRLGLGDGIDSINTVPDAGGGYVSLSLKRASMAEGIPAANLSDGQLSWLAFVAMSRLPSTRSLLAIDEPELHLHPQLLGGVVALLQRLKVPVVLATHSDRLLETLEDPAESVRVCELDDDGRATLSRLDGAELPRWLEHFGDLGGLRAAGYLSRVLLPPIVGDAE